MKYYEYGNKDLKSLCLIHDMMMGRSCFDNFVKIASQFYHIIVVSMDGYNPDDPEICFGTSRHEAEQLIVYVRDHLHGRLDIVYGLGMGSAVIMHLLKDMRIRLGTVIIDSMVIARNGRKDANYYMSELKLIQAGKTPNLLKKMGIPHIRLVMPYLYDHIEEDTLAASLIDLLLFSVPFSRLDEKSHYWYGEEDTLGKKMALRIKKENPTVTVKSFPEKGHGGLLDDPRLLLKEIKEASEHEVL